MPALPRRRTPLGALMQRLCSAVPRAASAARCSVLAVRLQHHHASSKSEMNEEVTKMISLQNQKTANMGPEPSKRHAAGRAMAGHGMGQGQQRPASTKDLAASTPR